MEILLGFLKLLAIKRRTNNVPPNLYSHGVGVNIDDSITFSARIGQVGGRYGAKIK